MRWDELVLRIEWNCEVEQLLNRTDLSPQQIQAIRNVSETMQYCFNTATVERWLKETETFGAAVVDIQKFVHDDFKNFY